MVRIERNAAVFTVILDRPEVRNAVDGPTALALADAFRAFEADPSASVAVLWGAGGNFCAGADLKAIGTERGNTVYATGNVTSPQIHFEIRRGSRPVNPREHLLSESARVD